MITCVIRAIISIQTRKPSSSSMRATGARRSRGAGADLVGGPHTPRGIDHACVWHLFWSRASAAYEQYKARLAADPVGHENYEFAKRERFLLLEDRTFLKLASAPHGALVQRSLPASSSRSKPALGRRDDYLATAAALKPILEQIVYGFISVERFQSFDQPEKMLSISFFRDEAAVIAWRYMSSHRKAQAAARGGDLPRLSSAHRRRRARLRFP